MKLSSLEWTVEYLPYIIRDDDGTERDLPNYRISSNDDSEHYIAETNEHLPDEIQEMHANLISAAPKLFEALEYFFNITHDYESSRLKGYIEQAMKRAQVALAAAKGNHFVNWLRY